MANISSISVSSPRDAVIDNHGYLVTVEVNTHYLDRFDPTTLNRINHISIPYSLQTAVTYFNGAFYIAPYYDKMTVIDSDNLTIISYISTSTYGIRGIIFLNNGQTMVVSSCDTNTLVFLNRTRLLPITYNFIFNRSTSFICPHGMWLVNDSFFYVTAYGSKSIYSFSATHIYTQWNETFVFTAFNGITTGGAAHVKIDESGRFWVPFETDTIFIYDQQGTTLGNLTIPNSAILDIKIMNNYLIYFTATNTNGIIRLDPNIQC